ncbi:MAG: flagellar motor switch protein FliG [Candidatus Poribacteria bacterium]|nr:flagellar motor switch protein FliG [Candidatus Poribacteria bacterium]
MPETLPIPGNDLSQPGKTLSGLEKAAALLIILGQENSGPILTNLAPKEIEGLTIQIGLTHVVSNDIRLQVLREFRMLLLAKQYIIQGGLEYARSLLCMAMDEGEADKLMERVQRIIEGNPFEFMEQANPSNLLELLRHEHPQTTSLILAHLSPRQASAIIQGLPAETKLDVIRRIADMDQIDHHVLNLLHQSLKGKISALLSTSQDQVGGPESVAEILNLVDSTSEKQIMSGLVGEDPELAEQVQSLMFTFDDLEHIDPRGIQRILAQAEMGDTILALKAATDTLKQKFLDCVSKRNAEGIAEELEIMGRIPLKDVEEAQQKILQIARDLEEAGEIVIIRGGGDDSQYI